MNATNHQATEHDAESNMYFEVRELVKADGWSDEAIDAFCATIVGNAIQLQEVLVSRSVIMRALELQLRDVAMNDGWDEGGQDYIYSLLSSKTDELRSIFSKGLLTSGVATA